MQPPALESLCALLALAGEPVHVARLELPAPHHSPFLLHATVPVPRGTALGSDGRPALWVESRDSAGTRVPAQVEIVSRSPDGKPDVIEVLARVELAPADRAGSQLSYWVGSGGDVAAPRPARPEPAVEELLKRANQSLLLRTVDVYGNIYLADLSGNAQDPSFGSLRLSKDGRWQRELRVASVFVPAGPASAEGAPLPHLMGVHAYLRTRAGEAIVGLDLRVHNGCCSGSRTPSSVEEPLGAVYWRSLELLVPREWNVLPEVADPFFGETREEGRWHVFSLVKPLPEGKLHWMPPQAQFERRLALALSGQESRARDELASEGLAFAQPGEGLWSWFAPACARWFAQRELLMDVGFFRRGAQHGAAAVRALEAERAQEYAQALATGKPCGWYSTASVMGWAHPWFLPGQGGIGGEALSICEGVWTVASASREGYQRLQYLHRMNVCRQSEAAWTRAGDPAGYQLWLDARGCIPAELAPGGDARPACFRLPMRAGPPASAQVREVIRRGLRPPYDQGNWFEADGRTPERSDDLLAWSPHDAEHLARYTKDEKALVWLGNDSLAKDDLLLSAELFRLAFHESPPDAAGAAPPGTLGALEALARAHPHQGADIGRASAWGIDAACAAYSVAAPEWRERNRAWFGRVAQLLCDLALPSGIIQRSLDPRILGDNRYTVAQTSDSQLLLHALRCLDESVFRGADEARSREVEELALRAVEYLYFGPPFQRVLAEWQPDPRNPSVFVQGPRWGFAISKNDDYRTPPFADAQSWGPAYLPPDGLGGGIECSSGLWLFDWARQISSPAAGTGLENRYLRRALEYGAPHKDFGELARSLEARARDLSADDPAASWSSFLAALQTLGVR